MFRLSAGFCVAVASAGCFSDTTTPMTVVQQSDGGTVSVPSVAQGNGPLGCTPSTGTTPPVAPGGYYTNGSQICTSDGQPHVFHGVDRPSFEWNSQGEHVSYDDFKDMAGWHAGIVRIAMNQDFWLSTAGLYDPMYRTNIEKAVNEAEAAGLDVILDLHWSDRGNLQAMLPGTAPSTDVIGFSSQQKMADTNSLEFWTEVAADFANDGHVFFELYNEPNNVSWAVWLNGGPVDEYMAVGMQDLYGAVRDMAHADNLVLIGGLNFAFDLSGVANNRVQGYNIVYATHPYKGNDTELQWASSFEYLATENIAPVIATEFGDSSTNCTSAWDQSLITVAAQPTIQMSWTAWAWYNGDPCSFPALVQGNWGSLTPTVQGMAVQAALASDPAPQPLIDPTPYENPGVPDAGAPGDGGDAGDGGAVTADASDATVEDGSSNDAESQDASALDADGGASASDADDGAPDGT